MAISTLQKLSAAARRLPPSLSSLRPIILARSSATLSHPPSPSSSTSAKVSDRIVKLSAIDVDGYKREVVGLAGQTLLKALTNSGLIDPASHRLEEIDACSAECEVNIAQEWLERLPARSYDEEYVLKRNSRARVLNKHSRLGCQVVLTKDLPRYGRRRSRAQALGYPSSLGKDIEGCDENVDHHPCQWCSVTRDALAAYLTSIEVGGLDTYRPWPARKGILMDPAELRRVFQMFDRNGDGRITRKELSDSLQNLGIHISDRDLAQMIEKIDVNGDGYVDIDEFGRVVPDDHG
ncbi:hypothetical protein NL676_022100 [Syzygium grande]|nr:hypothetical protein NL676_022100 [Syzygium grande]